MELGCNPWLSQKKRARPAAVVVPTPEPEAEPEPEPVLPELVIIPEPVPLPSVPVVETTFDEPAIQGERTLFAYVVGSPLNYYY